MHDKCEFVVANLRFKLDFEADSITKYAKNICLLLFVHLKVNILMCMTHVQFTVIKMN